MNKHEYLSALRNALSGLPSEEINKSADFYAEIIDDAVENGETEEEAVARLGPVEENAQKIINEMPLSRLVKENVKGYKWSASSIALIIILSPVWLPLVAAAFAVVLSLYISLWAIAASFFTVSIALALGGLTLITAAPFMMMNNSLSKALLSLGTGLTAVGFSVFVFYFSVIFSKLIIHLSSYIIRQIKESFIRKGGAENETI